MDFVAGNLQSYLRPDGAPPPPPGRPPELRFNPAMHFGPRPGRLPTFRFTFAVPRLTIVMEADPGEWSGFFRCGQIGCFAKALGLVP